MTVYIRLAFSALLLMLTGVGGVSAQQTESHRIAYVSNREGNEDIYVMSLLGENDQRANLTNHPARDWNPAWSPDGARIVFNSNREGRDTLYTVNFDGTDVRALFPNETFNDYEGVWSPDGERIAFVSDRAGIGRDIYIVDREGSVTRVTDTRTIKGKPVWSASGDEIIFWDQRSGEEGAIDLFRISVGGQSIFRLTNRSGKANGMATVHGEKIYFDSDRSNGAWAIYSINMDGSLPQRITSLDAGNNGRASVSPDGMQIVYVSDQFDSDEIMIANIDGPGTPRRLTENFYSDHSPAWQPAVPQVQAAVAAPPVRQETPAASDEPLPPAIGQSFAGDFDTYPITLEQLLADYNINVWHDAGWTGAGIRIGVIDLSFGDLDIFISDTGSVRMPEGHILAEYSNSNNKHGTQVLEIIRTIAYNAELYACRYTGKLEELKTCREWMRDNNVKIINHSVGAPIMPMDGTNPWAQMVDDTFSLDILWVNAAGNFQRGYYAANFNDINGDNSHDFIFGNAYSDFVVPVSADAPYSGTVMLSWDDPTENMTVVESYAERPNLDLEILDASGKKFPIVQRDQASDLSEPPLEVAMLSDVKAPFIIRIVNNGEPLTESIRFNIFVEYLEVPDHAFGSVIGPGDARYSLTVAAINGRGDIGPYSSRGLINERYQKPDIAAPGEIIMRDGTNFIGTSAAAPVVSGIAALLLEQDRTLNIDRLRRNLLENWREQRDSNAYGRGVIRIAAPSTEREGENIIQVPPKTVFPQIEDEFVDQGYTCPGAIEPRLEVGLDGYVNYDLGLAIRRSPGGQEIDRLRIGMRFTVIEGPVCLSAANWWYVQLETGAFGWVAEGDRYYLLAPINLGSAQLPKVYDTVCVNALATQLAIGERGRLTFGNAFFFRSEGARNEMRPPQAGSILHILGGPVCEGRAGNVLRWYVRVVEGSMTGYEGWIAEGDTDARIIEPWSGH